MVKVKGMNEKFVKNNEQRNLFVELKDVWLSLRY